MKNGLPFFIFAREWKMENGHPFFIFHFQLEMKNGKWAVIFHFHFQFQWKIKLTVWGVEWSRDR